MHVRQLNQPVCGITAYVKECKPMSAVSSGFFGERSLNKKQTNAADNNAVDILLANKDQSQNNECKFAKCYHARYTSPTLSGSIDSTN